MPVLLSTVNTARTAATERLRAAQATTAGEVFTVAGQDLRRSRTTHASAGITWAEDPHTGKRRDLSLEEHQSFWTWAAVEVLRHTVVRIEELTELSHHSLIQYTLPATGELIPLLQIAPSKTDTERLLVISPELADVLSAIVCRIRGNNGAVPLVIAYDYHERATSSAARSRWEPAAAPTPPPASTNTPASAARCPLPAARCPLLRPDPAQRPRLVELCDNLGARIGEAEREGWLGEVDGLQVSLAAARNKLTQLDELATRTTAVTLGMPTTAPAP